jgi:pSer/pThr/pTyr-binding forkhead associated (FHA) protein
MRVRKEALRGPVVRIGRSSDCEVVIGDPRVSRIHATLELQEGSYRLADARSTGGTFLDGRPVHEAVPLRAGAIIRLGRDEEDPVTLVYHEEDPDGESA